MDELNEGKVMGVSAYKGMRGFENLWQRIVGIVPRTAHFCRRAFSLDNDDTRFVPSQAYEAKRVISFYIDPDSDQHHGGRAND